MQLISQWITVLSGYLKMVTIFDVLDVAITAYVIYRILLRIRRSRAAQVTKAILIILAALWISYKLRLNVINFVLGKMVEMGLLALIVVFQPEIRRFLEKVGNNQFRLIPDRAANEDVVGSAIKQTVSACGELSKGKVGALIVFERGTPMDEYLASGTMLDAAVTAELLKNIFWPKAPLHDGAAIVRGGRLAGAGCMLPLSGNINLSKDLGMRHRAGIGMSENSDAVVVIVSEETGAISVAIGGMLKRHLALDTLEQLLSNELVRQPADIKSGFRVTSLFENRKGGDSSERN